MAHLLWGKNMLTPMLKLCLVVSLSCDPGQQQIFEFDVNIFLSRSRWATRYYILKSSDLCGKSKSQSPNLLIKVLRHLG